MSWHFLIVTILKRGRTMVFFSKANAGLWAIVLFAFFLCFDQANALLFASQAKEGAVQLPLLFADDFKDGRAGAWLPNRPEHWQVAKEEGSFVYRLTAPGEQGKVRAPTSWSLLKDFDVTSFVFTGRTKCKTDPAVNQRDICIFFHFQDETHFYYVHFSASSDEMHNVIAIVNGKDRVKINREPPGKSIYRLTDLKFHDLKVSFDAATGEIKAYLDDMSTPILTAADKILDHGLVGVGSFDDTGSFADIKLWGNTFKK
jgi:hypothetical protein